MIKWLILGCILVCIFLFVRIKWELCTFRIKHYTVRCSKLKERKHIGNIVFISDLHNHLYGRHNEKLLEAIRAENPKLILIGGDILVGKRDVSYQNALEFVKALCEVCPVYYANGNHEQRMKENTAVFGNAFSRYRSVLAKAGVHFLENSSLEAVLDGQNIRISGLELSMKSYEKMKKYEVPVSDIVRRIGNAAKEEMQILLAHNPEYCNAYLEWGADLVLSGHLHGGLVCLPNGKSIITPQFHFFPKYSGEMTEENSQTVIVSRGLGTHTVNVRLFNRAELIVLHLTAV